MFCVSHQRFDFSSIFWFRKSGEFLHILYHNKHNFPTFPLKHFCKTWNNSPPPKKHCVTKYIMGMAKCSSQCFYFFSHFFVLKKWVPVFAKNPHFTKFFSKKICKKLATTKITGNWGPQRLFLLVKFSPNFDFKNMISPYTKDY